MQEILRILPVLLTLLPGLPLLLAVLLVLLLPGLLVLLRPLHLHPHFTLTAALQHQAQGGGMVAQQLGGMLVFRPQ